MLDLKKLSASVTVYGSPLYKETTVIGSVAPGEYTVADNVVKIPVTLEDGSVGFIYARVKSSVVEAGYDDSKVFTIAEYTALRDASGTTDNGTWSVKAGDVKLFAY